VLCNSLLPVRGPQVSETAFVAAAAAFWSQQMAALAAAAGRRTSPLQALDSTPLRLQLVAGDVACLLDTFARGRSFSQESHGGGRLSNSRLLPCLLQLGAYYAGQCLPGEVQGMRALLLEAAQPPGPAPGGGVAYRLALALLLLSPQEWRRQRCLLLEAALQQEAGRLPGVQSPAEGCARLAAQPETELLQQLGPALRLFGLADWLQVELKGAPERAQGEEWRGRLEGQLRDLGRVWALGEAFVGQLGELEGASDLQEAVDVMGLLGEVLGHKGGVSCVAEFVRAALREGSQQQGAA
jgi:E3 ubiquitin-protein ligase UBR4